MPISPRVRCCKGGVYGPVQMSSALLASKLSPCCGKNHSTLRYMFSPSHSPKSNATIRTSSCVPSATVWFGPTYVLVPVPVAIEAPQESHCTDPTDPVGSPPFENAGGLTSPKPEPPTKEPARPSVGSDTGLAAVVVAAIVVVVVAVGAAIDVDRDVSTVSLPVLTSWRPDVENPTSRNRAVSMPR